MSSLRLAIVVPVVVTLYCVPELSVVKLNDIVLLDAIEPVPVPITKGILDFHSSLPTSTHTPAVAR